MIKIDIYKHKIWGKEIISKTEIKKIVLECLKQTNFKVKNVFLNVSFVNSELIKDLNFKHCNKNLETNILSFEDKNCKINKLLFGDIVLCYEKIKNESIQFNKPFKDRLYHLFIHGILHLIGYNHINDKDRNKMETLETKILLKFNIKNPYFYNL